MTRPTVRDDAYERDDPTTAPHTIYYNACVGAWSGPTELRIGPLSALRRAVGLSDALSMWLLARLARRLSLHTSVRFTEDGRVLHTTALRWGRVTLMRSSEHITLGADGVSITLEGRTALPLIPWRRAPVTGTGAVAEDAGTTEYALTFLGGPMRQVATRDGDAVTLEQTMPGYHATHRLRRET